MLTMGHSEVLVDCLHLLDGQATPAGLRAVNTFMIGNLRSRMYDDWRLESHQDTAPKYIN